MTLPKRTRAANGRSSIGLEKDGRWHGYVSMGPDARGRAIRRHVSARSRAEVTRKVRRLETERDDGRATVPGRRTSLEVYLQRWIARRALDVRSSTLVGYEVDAKHITRTIGHVRLDRVESTDIERLWSAMVEANVIGSISHVRRTLSACLSDAVREGLISRNPVKTSRRPRYESPEISPYTIEEVRSLLQVAARQRNAPRWTLAAVLGLRQSEVLGLQWGDLDLDAGTLTVRRQLSRSTWKHGCADPTQCGKRGADCPLRFGGGLTTSEPKSRAGRRTIAIPASLIAELTAHRSAQLAERLAAAYWEEGAAWVFATEWGAPIDQRRDWAAFKRLLDDAGLRNARLHDLRHAAATLMLESDTDLQTAGQILGHGSIVQTQRYTHVLAERQRAAAARMDALVWGTATS